MPTPFEPIVRFIREIYPNRELIPLHEPVFGHEEEEALLACLRSTHVASTGLEVAAFEETVCRYTGSPYAVATVNGTAALHLALHALGIGPGDLVLTQALTFAATVNAIRYTGAIPRYLDIEAGTWAFSPAHLDEWLRHRSFRDTEGTLREKSSGLRVAACLPVHTFGLPAQTGQILDCCNAFGIPLVEDAAEALGTFREGKHAGTLGVAGVLSFNGNKIITTGGGGMVLTHDEALALRLRHLSTQSKQPHRWEYIHDGTGFNYRMPNINAALGLAQMAGMQARLDSKRAVGARYRTFFRELGAQALEEPEGCQWNHWLNG
ncbi:MAG TPA: aminotransferase class I/II-fold pyridoxal phosphate-dependent enzyme, partial [Bacteroidales bacterium]|nr:aminotransferase class I/II-fold pyridoxal phosphate-dependent enzyme [Bacteroidales bacterium]